MPVKVKLSGSEIVEQTFGFWPTFHDAEIVTVFLDRDDVSISLQILITQFRGADSEGGQDEPRVKAHYKVVLRFHDIENLELRDFNYQNVISALVLSPITEERFTMGKREERVKVEIDSVFGGTCSFTCSGGEVVGFEETSDRTGKSRLRRGHCLLD